jgi:hypothetical protein
MRTENNKQSRSQQLSGRHTEVLCWGSRLSVHLKRLLRSLLTTLADKWVPLDQTISTGIVRTKSNGLVY